MRARVISILSALLLVLSAAAARADVPFFNASCPRHIEVHADAGGPVFVNGHRAELHRFNSSYYEATHGRTTVSIMVNPDHSLNISYTTTGGANGVCQVNVQQRHGRNVQPEQPAPTLAIPVGRMPRFCSGEASSHFNVQPRHITAQPAFKIGERYVVAGTYAGARGTAFFNCFFDTRGNFVQVNP